MTRSPSKFRQRDLARALKAVRAAGVEVGRVEVEPDGKIVVIAGKPGDEQASSNNPWDEATP